MNTEKKVQGIIAAVVTPLDSNGRPHLDNLQLLIKTVIAEGVNGILLLGTTGEGPSFSLDEQADIISAGLEAAEGIFVLSCTVNVSLVDAINATRKACALGVDGIVALPPYYYKNLKKDGLIAYFSHILDEAIPEEKQLFLYHIPQLTGVPITIELLDGLMEYAPTRIGGVKDSQGDLANTIEYCQRYPQLKIFVGTDRLLLDGIRNGAAGCITAGSNVLCPLDSAVYQQFLRGEDASVLQEKLTSARLALEKFPPFPPTLKSLLSYRFHSNGWNVRAPLVPLEDYQQSQLLNILRTLPVEQYLPWININL
jgi:4-hydroxy-tetrahydrodipicolinate synthase